MVTFNFSNVSGNANGTRFQFLTPTTTTSTTPTSGFVNQNFFTTTKEFSLGNNPITLTSALNGVGLPGNTMVFTIFGSSEFYTMNFSDAQDRLELGPSAGTFASPATFTMNFDAGSGLTRLSNVTINGGSGISGFNFLEFFTENGTVSGAAGTGTFGGPVTGIRFPIFDGTTISSICGTPTCFARGTRIAVPGGECAVEALRPGDTILTHDGDTRDVLWVGRQSFDLRTGMPERLSPVRIKAGALGDVRPTRDLVLTADHALLIDGILVNAAALVNGHSIAYEPVSATGKRLTVFHIETEDHAVILAEGAAAETYIDVAERAQFDNYAEYLDLYDADRPIAEAPYPRVSSARLLPPHIAALVKKEPLPA